MSFTDVNGKQNCLCCRVFSSNLNQSRSPIYSKYKDFHFKFTDDKSLILTSCAVTRTLPVLFLGIKNETATKKLRSLKFWKKERLAKKQKVTEGFDFLSVIKCESFERFQLSRAGLY